MSGNDRLKSLLAEPEVVDRDTGFAARIVRRGRLRTRRTAAAGLLWNSVIVAWVGAASGGAVAGLVWLVRFVLNGI